MHAMQGSLYTPLAALVIGRDVFLVTGAFALRFRSLGWKWPGWQEFFRTTESAGGSDYEDKRPHESLLSLYLDQWSAGAFRDAGYRGALEGRSS